MKIHTGSTVQAGNRVPFAPRRNMLALESRIVFDGAGATDFANQASTAASEAALMIRPAATVEIAHPVQQIKEADTLKIVTDTLVASSVELSNPTQQGRVELVFIENNLSDFQQLVAGIGAGKEIHILDATKDGLQQIAQIVAGRSNIDAFMFCLMAAMGRSNWGH